MDKIKLSKGQVLHKKGDVVNTLEIVLSGALAVNDDNGVTVRLENGAMAGAAYNPGDVYSFDHIALTDSVLMVADYTTENDIAEAVKSTAAIAPAMATASMNFAVGLLESVDANYEAAEALCKELKYNYMDYSFLCVKLEKEPEKFPFIESMIMPESSTVGDGWEAEACRAFAANGEELKKGFYAMDVSFSVSTVMQAYKASREYIKALETIMSFIAWTKDGSNDFVRAYYDVKSRTDTQSRDGLDGAPEITNALEIILAFSSVEPEVADAFRRDIKAYSEVADRRAKSDEMRTLRSSITKGFYEIYESAFLRSLETNHIPIEVRMFFLFGFVDENLAGDANTRELYNVTVRWEADPEDRILSMYDWLLKIYTGEAMPSKNEFNNDWIAYLREAVRSNNITQQEADKLKTDRLEMLHFEIQNMFMSSNRITTGRMASFVPIFCSHDIIKPLDKCMATPMNIQAVMDKILEIDYSLFYRPTFAEYPELKLPRFNYNLEVRPYIILTPNYGERGVMWQETEGANRQTPAHMIISIFHSASLEETLIKMCGDFRWELCRRIQGIHYADITDLSLTSEYMDFLQFYKKNGNLTNDMKERIKLALQKARNDFKGVFVADYISYIQKEAYGQLRLNKLAREIVFKYCPLSRKYRSAVRSNQQYSVLIDRWSASQANKLKTLEMLERKLENMKPAVKIPPELISEIEFLRM